MSDDELSDQLDLAPARAAAAVALLKRIRYHAQRHALPRAWLTAADEVLGTWGPVKLTHPEIAAANEHPLPAPEPLTDEAVVAMWQATEFRGNGGQYDWFSEGVRAAERAHGILPKRGI